MRRVGLRHGPVAGSTQTAQLHRSGRRLAQSREGVKPRGSSTQVRHAGRGKRGVVPPEKRGVCPVLIGVLS